MFRIFGCFGLGIIFLWISPKLRMEATNAIGTCAAVMSMYAPFSYLVSGVALIIFMMMAFKRGAAPR